MTCLQRVLHISIGMATDVASNTALKDKGIGPVLRQNRWVDSALDSTAIYHYDRHHTDARSSRVDHQWETS